MGYLLARNAQPSTCRSESRLLISSECEKNAEKSLVLSEEKRNFAEIIICAGAKQCTILWRKTTFKTMVIRERRKRIYRKRIPYGMQNFEDVIREDCYYVDKTPFIEDIEGSNKYFFYIRPRRFGKTLTLSMLENYYDVNKKDHFDTIFGHLYIGQNPTPEHNSYLIIHLNFAVIVGGLDDYQSGMDNYCSIQFNYFVDVYSHLLPEGTKEGLNQQKDAVSQLNYLYNRKRRLESQLAYKGDYKAYFDFIADSLKRHSSQRDKQKGEAFVHGFTLAMTCQNQFYRPISELDNDGGYADIFLSPLCDIYKDMVDSYIIELKYCKSGTSNEQLAQLLKDATAQVNRYADSDTVRDLVKTTQLHKLVVIYRGAEMAACEEV